MPVELPKPTMRPPWVVAILNHASVENRVGLAWACGTLLFLALEPTVGAHLPVVMTDLPLALSLAIAALCAGLLASTWRWRWAIGCGLAMGVALASKHSALAALAGLGGLGFGLAIAACCGWRQAWSRAANTLWRKRSWPKPSVAGCRCLRRRTLIR